MITIITNGLILALLIGAIGYTYLMDLRVRKLLVALNELEPMVGQFSKAVKQSETSLKELKQVTAQKQSKAKNSKLVNKTSNATSNRKKLTFETSRKVAQDHVGLISLSEKSDLVKSFFETAERQEL